MPTGKRGVRDCPDGAGRDCFWLPSPLLKRLYFSCAGCTARVVRCRRGEIWKPKEKNLSKARSSKTGSACLVLGIESSCDETAAAVVRRDEAGRGEILSNVVRSQVEEHVDFGGVVPELAARSHVVHLDQVVGRALELAGVRADELDAVAATAGPGLIGGVLVGLTTAKALCAALDKPLIGVNHLEGHALTARLSDRVGFPFLLLLVSGGHSQFLLVRDVGDYEIWGATIDDALGEAFDKVAKMLGLGYPGGPEVERLAARGDGRRFDFPRPLIHREGLDFSFSGLKTAVRQAAEKAAPLSARDMEDVCAGFQASIVDIISRRSLRALERFEAEFEHVAPCLVVAGGVAANRAIARALEEVCRARGARLVVPPTELCTDNGAMVAWAGAERFVRGAVDDLDICARARWPLDDPGMKISHDPLPGRGGAG